MFSVKNISKWWNMGNNDIYPLKCFFHLRKQSTTAQGKCEQIKVLPSNSCQWSWMFISHNLNWLFLSSHYFILLFPSPFPTGHFMKKNVQSKHCCLVIILLLEIQSFGLFKHLLLLKCIHKFWMRCLATMHSSWYTLMLLISKLL